MAANVIGVFKSKAHTFHKCSDKSISLKTGFGVVGDAHFGETVKHRSRVAKDPTQPNLRQVHLIHSELFDELTKKGFSVQAGDLGENITTQGIDLLGLSAETCLKIGEQAVVKITGLRNPCAQLDNFQRGLMKAVLDRDERGNLIRKAGVMGIVISDGEIKPGDRIEIKTPDILYRALEPV